MFGLPVLPCYIESCLSLLVQMGTHCVGSAAEKVGSWGAKYTSLCLWCWQHYSVLDVLCSPFHLSFTIFPPTYFATKGIFLLGSTNDSPSQTVLQPYVSANPKQLTFKQQGTVNSANRATTLSQQGFLFKANEMLIHQRKTGKSGEIKALMLYFLYLC